MAIPDIQDGRLDLSKARLISREDFASWTRKTKPQQGDIIVTRRGRVGDTAVVPAGLECAIGQNLVILRSDGRLVDQSYLRWALQGPMYRQQVEKYLNVGAIFDSLNCADIPKFEIPAPPLHEQRRIASVLGALEDKIELNRRMNETLEALARAIFKSWFVDFDPTRTKVEGGEPQRQASALARFFPSRLECSELGLLPVGWRIGQLGDIANVIDCLHSKKPVRSNSGRPLLQLWNIRDDGLLDMTDTYWVSEDDYLLWTSRIEVREGDCVVTNVGRVGASAQVPAGFRAALGRNMTAVRCRLEFPFPTFLSECLRSDAMTEEIARKVDTGTILDALNVRNIPKLRLVLPPMELLTGFEQLVRPFRQRMELNLRETQTLTAIRDALLPKLLSGELRVTDAEQVVGMAV